MFECRCPHCGRRELRGPRSLRPTPTGAWVADCRACGLVVTVVAGRRPVPVPVPAPALVAA